MSPTIYRHKGYRFFFFSREEPRAHIHIVSADGEAKFWIEPEIELAKSVYFNSKQLKEIKNFIFEHKKEIRDAWNNYFGS